MRRRRLVASSCFSGGRRQGGAGGDGRGVRVSRLSRGDAHRCSSPKDLGKKLSVYEKRASRSSPCTKLDMLVRTRTTGRPRTPSISRGPTTPLKTSRCSARLGGCGGGDMCNKYKSSAKDARSAPRGSTALEVVKATRLDDATRRRPIFAQRGVARSASVLACGDAAATPCRLETTTSAGEYDDARPKGAVIAVRRAAARRRHEMLQDAF